MVMYIHDQGTCATCASGYWLVGDSYCDTDNGDGNRDDDDDAGSDGGNNILPIGIGSAVGGAALLGTAIFFVARHHNFQAAGGKTGGVNVGTSPNDDDFVVGDAGLSLVEPSQEKGAGSDVVYYENATSSDVVHYDNAIYTAPVHQSDGNGRELFIILSF